MGGNALGAHVTPQNKTPGEATLTLRGERGPRGEDGADRAGGLVDREPSRGEAGRAAGRSGAMAPPRSGGARERERPGYGRAGGRGARRRAALVGAAADASAPVGASRLWGRRESWLVLLAKDVFPAAFPRPRDSREVERHLGSADNKRKDCCTDARRGLQGDRFPLQW